MGSYRFKIILAGDEAVGKTCVVMRFVHNTYSELYKPTLGFQISVKLFNYLGPDNKERSVILSIWDIAGQGQFQSVRRGYYQGADGVLLLFDITRRETFENAKRWAEEIRTVAPAAPIVLVGNKTDLLKQAVLPPELTYVSHQYKFASYVISSAATGRGIEEMFRCVSDAIIEAISRPAGTTPVVQVPTPIISPEEVKLSIIRPQVDVPLADVELPVTRCPHIIPQLEIKLSAVRSVSPEEPKLIIVSPPPPPTPVGIPVKIESPIAPQVPVLAPVKKEHQTSPSSPLSPTPAPPSQLSEKREPPVNPSAPSSLPDEQKGGTPQPKPEKKKLWERFYHQV